jgi:hypothetical protein
MTNDTSPKKGDSPQAALDERHMGDSKFAAWYAQRHLAVEPMKQPQAEPDMWTLIAPDGRTFSGASPILALREEQRARIPDKLALERIQEMIAEGDSPQAAIERATPDGNSSARLTCSPAQQGERDLSDAAGDLLLCQAEYLMMTTRWREQHERADANEIDAQRWRLASTSRNHGITFWGQHGQGTAYGPLAEEKIDAALLAAAKWAHLAGEFGS